VLTGLLEKALREMGIVVVLTCLGLGLVVGLFVQILPQFYEGLNALVTEVPLLQMIMSGMMGMDASQGLAPQMLLVVVWSHPTVLAIVWGFLVVLGSRVPAAEIERGTVDVLLGWPVARSTVYLAEVILSLASGVLLLACAFSGYVVSMSTLPADLQPDLGNTLLILVNLLALYVAVGGMVQCISAACDRRGKAMGIAVALLVATHLLGFLSNLWEPAERLAFASLVTYYQPAQVMLGGELPWTDVLVLLLVGGALWTLGGVVWSRRSVLTV
jgi:ABC-2 type transport system permease protein